MTLLQIITDPTDWDNSRLQVVGKIDPITGRTLNPSATLIIAKDLPEPHLATWHDTVESLRSEGQGDWDIVQVDVQEITLQPAPETPEANGGTKEGRGQETTEGQTETDHFPEVTKMIPEPKPALEAKLHRQYTDGTCDSFYALWDSPDLLDLFYYLTQSPSLWQHKI